MNGLFGKVGAITILLLAPILWGVIVGWIFTVLQRLFTADRRENSRS